MKDVRIILELASDMLELAEDDFERHRCNDLAKFISERIPVEWCEEMRQLNSKGTDPWPDNINQIGDCQLMWFLAAKLKDISKSLDRDLKIEEVLK